MVPIRITKTIITQTSQLGISGNGSAISHFHRLQNQTHFNCQTHRKPMAFVMVEKERHKNPLLSILF